MIFGAAYQTVTSISKVCEDVVGKTRVQVLCDGDTLAHRRVFIVVGLSTLRKNVVALRRCRAVIILVDALPALVQVKDIRIVDASVSAVGRWCPEKPRWRSLRRVLTKRTTPATADIEFLPDATVANLIREFGSRGVLHSVLTFAQRADAPSRGIIHDCVSRYFFGTLSLSTVARRTRPNPPRGARVKLHADMIASLGSDRAVALREAVRRSSGGEDPAVLATELNVDAFEIRYVTELRRRHATK